MQGMNHAGIKSRAATSDSARMTKTVRPIPSTGCQGKIIRPPGFSALSHAAGGATTPALTKIRLDLGGLILLINHAFNVTSK